MNDTDWIKPGAEVVVWRDTFSGDVPNPATSTVRRVATKSFTVAGYDDRFDIDHLATKRRGSTWTGWRYRVVSADSDKARELYEAERRHVVESRAHAAVTAWLSNRTRESRLAAVEALQAVED